MQTATTSSMPVLLVHQPGLVTTIEFPNAVECHWKGALAELKISMTRRMASSSLSSRGVVTGGVGRVLDVPQKVGGRQSSYDNIIERLERKYSKGIVPNDEDQVMSEDDMGQDDDDDDNGVDNDGMDEEMDVSGEDGGGGASGSGGEKKPPKKKRGLNQDAYDMEDDFIDDSECAQEIEMAVKNKSTKTKHSGFFASSGQLELLSAAAESPPPSSGVATPKSSGGIDKCVQSPPGTVNTGTTTGVAPSAPSSATASGSAHHVPAKEKKLRVSKALWQPNASIIAALDIFRAQAELLLNQTGGERMKKNVFPRSLDAALHTLDTEVLRSIPNVETHFSGYWEELVSIVGGASMMSVGIIKNSLKRLRLKASVDLALKTKDSRLRALLEFLPTRVTKFDHTSVTANDETASGDGNPPTAFLYSCSWDIEGRGLLVAVERACEEWVTAENAYRKILTNLDKKGLSKEAIEGLDFKSELAALLVKIQQSFPESCQNSDPSCLRKQMNQERNRLKRKEAKASTPTKPKGASAEATCAAVPSPAAAVTGIGASSSSAATSAGAQSGSKAESTKADSKRPILSTLFVAAPKFTLTDFFS